MGRWTGWLLAGTIVLLSWAALANPGSLTVVQAGPVGEVAELKDANEVRVLFSEPMVTLGRVPDPAVAPFFHISPAVPGRLRWSGTRLLIFSPDPRLPYATRYEVTIDAGTTSADGRRLEKPFTFAFATPSVRLKGVEWQRKTGRYDSPVLLYLRFNQPVSPQAAAAHASLRHEPHPWAQPAPPDASAGPAALEAFRAKAERVRSVAHSREAVPVRLAPEWDKKTFPPAPELVVLETGAVPAPDAWLRLEVGPKVPSPGGPETPGETQAYTVRLEPTFFVKDLHCSRSCRLDDYNGVRFFGVASAKATAAKLEVRRVDASGAAVRVARSASAQPAEEEEAPGREDSSSSVSFDQLGYSFEAMTTYRLRLPADLKAGDGQTLGYDWTGSLQYGRRSAFLSFGDTQGVWEASSGLKLPYHARNVKGVEEWAAWVKPENLVPTALWVEGLARLPSGRFRRVPAEDRVPKVPSKLRTYSLQPDLTQYLGFDVAPYLSPRGTGIVWLGAKVRQALPSSVVTDPKPRATLVQVTNLGISVKDSPQNTLVLVTRLSDGAPVEGADVEVRTPDNRVFRRGKTGRSGIVVFSSTPLRQRLRWEKEEVRPRRPADGEDGDPQDDDAYYGYDYGRPDLHYVVTARKDDDLAYALSNWNEGLESWEFGVYYSLYEAKPLLRGTVFPDRGVYKLGEEVHWKAILRSDTAKGIGLLPEGTTVRLTLRDSQNKVVDKRELPLSAWGSADWVTRIPPEGALGSYRMAAQVKGQRGAIYGQTLVAAYRRPDFRVDAALSGPAGGPAIAGATLAGSVTGRYLFGAPMAGRPVRITVTRAPLWEVPQAVQERFPGERFAFLEEAWTGDGSRGGSETVLQREGTLGEDGAYRLDVSAPRDAGRPYSYTVEGEVTDVSRQVLAGRASFPVHPAPWYLALRRPKFFVDRKDGLKTDVAAVTPEGRVAEGVPVTLTLLQVQWVSVRRAEGGGFYTWESQRVEKERWTGRVLTGGKPVPVTAPLAEGGFYILAARATDPDGRSTVTTLDFYAMGGGYTAWERYDHNRIDLVPEKTLYRPGETARVLIKSPWERATALLTTEREGIRTHREFTLTSTQQTVEVPVTEAHIPNVYVSVLLIKGRTSAEIGKDGSDPGKPAFRLGYAQLQVENAGKRLSVTVTADREEYRPLDTARLTVEVKDALGKPVTGEVTLWAVDYGVLSLTGYRTPDVLDSVYVKKALQVANVDSRQRLVSRRATEPKGGEEGGGGGYEEGAENKARKDFRVLAFWLGSAVTDSSGRLTVAQKLPEALTTYRIMAVAADKASRFGRADREIRLSKPVLLTLALPRFLALGDRAQLGAVVHSQLAQGGSAEVWVKSLTPELLTLSGPERLEVAVGTKGAQEARFGAEALGLGLARLQVGVKLLGEEDAVELSLPIRLPVSPETVAAYGTAAPRAQETLTLPGRVVPGFGGLALELSSTALVGLGEGARYLVDYPYGCAEQKSSAALALLLAGELGAAFRLPGIRPDELRTVTQRTLRDLEAFQCPEGGFVFWKGDPCFYASPYLTSWVVHVYQRAERLGYDVSRDVLERAYGYLEGTLNQPPAVNEAYRVGHTSWQAFAAKILAEAGRNVDSHVTRLYGYRDRMPVYGLCFLWDAMAASKEAGERPEDLNRRIGNTLLPEGGGAHVEELADPELSWYWSSTTRSTAIALGSLVRNRADRERAGSLVRWLMNARKDGRWGNTQENAWALEALVDYYRRHEAEAPDFRAAVALGTQFLVRETFQGRDTRVRASDTPLARLLALGKAGEPLPLRFEREGSGTLHYAARLTYADASPDPKAMSQGFRVERRYEPLKKEGESRVSFQAGDLVQVVLTFDLPKERHWVAVADPIPAGFEPVESWFQTTAADLAEAQRSEQAGSWEDRWRRGGFDHVERHDDKVLLFATRLSEGTHTYRYTCRATTAGTFRVAPARAEEMYEPEVFGRTSSQHVEVRP